MLQGKTVEQIKSETLANVPAKTNVTVVVGVVYTNGSTGSATIPLPSGYTRGQCRYFINTNIDFGFNSSLINQSTGIFSIGSDYRSAKFAYLCIAVK